MNRNSESVGFIGLGIMGKPMARNLLRAGFRLVVHNRSRGPVDELASEGALSAASPREVAEACDVIVTMLPDSQDVADVVTGDNGVLSGARRGSLLIDMSTISPSTAVDLAKKAEAQGVSMLDAPVSGGDVGARQATLSIMVGGSEKAFERARPLLEAMGKTIIRTGGAGSGQIVKACNQIVVALTIEAVSEALVLGSKAGVDPEIIIKVLSGGLAANRVLEIRKDNMLRHDFKPGFKVDLHHKDICIALATSRELGVPLPVTSLVNEMLLALRVKGLGQHDHSALLTIVEEWAHHRIGSLRDPVEKVR